MNVGDHGVMYSSPGHQLTGMNVATDARYAAYKSVIVDATSKETGVSDYYIIDRIGPKLSF